jgi:DNA repair exonuclease SbcCD nuclease subunit
VNIGLLHTSLAGAEGHDTYAPCSLADLTGHGFDYWGLGHVHKRQVHAESPCTVVMPGIPQGRDIGETGPKSVTLVTIDNDRNITLEERVTSIAQFDRAKIDVTGLAEWRDVLDALETGLGEIRNAAASDHLVARLEIGGGTTLAPLLRRDSDVLLDEARQAAASLPRTAIEKISVDVHAPAIPGDVPGYDPVAELKALIEGDVLGSAPFRANIREIVTDLQRQLPPELRDSLGDTDEAIEETIARIITEGGEDVLARLDSSETAG